MEEETAGPYEKVKKAEAEPRAQPKLVHGCFRRHARLNEAQPRAPEDLNPFGAQLTLCGQGEQEG